MRFRSKKASNGKRNGLYHKNSLKDAFYWNLSQIFLERDLFKGDQLPAAIAKLPGQLFMDVVGLIDFRIFGSIEGVVSFYLASFLRIFSLKISRIKCQV